MLWEKGELIPDEGVGSFFLYNRGSVKRHGVARERIPYIAVGGEAYFHSALRSSSSRKSDAAAYQWMVDPYQSDIVGCGSLTDTGDGRGWLQCTISDNLSLAS